MSISYLTYLSSDSLLFDIVTICPGSYLVTRQSVSSRTLNYYLSINLTTMCTMKNRMSLYSYCALSMLNMWTQFNESVYNRRFLMHGSSPNAQSMADVMASAL